MLKHSPWASSCVLRLVGVLILLNLSFTMGSSLDNPGGCGPPSPCGFAGICVEIPGPTPKHRCDCKQPFNGEDCSYFVLGQPVKVGSVVHREIALGAWDYFELQLPINAPVYQDALNIKLDTEVGQCGFVLSDNRIQFFTSWHPVGYNLSDIYSASDHFYHSTPLSLMQQNTISLSVYGINHCRYSGSFQINTTLDTICQHGAYKDGICACTPRWTGPNCSKFSFPLVYTMAIAAGTFIFGAVIASLMAGCLFRRASEIPSPQTIQGYEQYR